MNSPAHCSPLTQATLLVAVSRLVSIDHELSAIVSAHGIPPLWARRPSFATLIQITLEQQVTLASAAASYRRLSSTLGRVTPHRILERAHGELTALGLTRQKARYCQEIARAVVSDRLDLPSLHHASSEQVRLELTRIVGIGRWTADIYLLMALRRPDVWPRGDLALYQALREVKRSNYSPQQLDELARHWRPWRAVAARILWHYYLRIRRS